MYELAFKRVLRDYFMLSKPVQEFFDRYRGQDGLRRMRIMSRHANVDFRDFGMILRFEYVYNTIDDLDGIAENWKIVAKEVIDDKSLVKQKDIEKSIYKIKELYTNM